MMKLDYWLDVYIPYGLGIAILASFGYRFYNISYCAQHHHPYLSTSLRIRIVLILVFIDPRPSC